MVFIVIFSILLAGCGKESFNEVKNEGNKIVVQNRVGQADTYEELRELTDQTSIEKVKGILDSIGWRNAKVSMIHPPDYKFYFEGNTQSSRLIYELWISPNRDRVELVLGSESKYVQIDKNKSAELFEILTGKNLK